MGSTQGGITLAFQLLYKYFKGVGGKKKAGASSKEFSDHLVSNKFLLNT